MPSVQIALGTMWAPKFRYTLLDDPVSADVALCGNCSTQCPKLHLLCHVRYRCPLKRPEIIHAEQFPVHHENHENQSLMM